MTGSNVKSKPSFIVHGLAGEKKLKGSIKINGAKNSALKAMAASVLFDGPVELANIPDTDDIETLTQILQKLGAKVTKSQNNNLLIIDSTPINSTDIDLDLAKGMRASVVLTGPLLARYGKVSFPAPGGCVIGPRLIDIFLTSYEKMGAIVKEDDFLYDISAKKLSSGEITFRRISVGATETLMMAAILLDGKTVLNNCAQEPEIINLAEWLNKCGAKITGVGTSTITIQGTNGTLLTPKVPFVTIPDRIEAGSFLILAALSAEDMTIEDCEPKHMGALIALLEDSGVVIDKGSTSIRVTKSSTPYKVFNLKTQEYPGFPTDLQAPMVVYLTQADGESRVVETIFEGRFKYIEDLIVMGADIVMKSPQEIVIKGPRELAEPLDETEMTAHDIRAGFAVVMAAIIGKGKFTINNVHLIDRGYEKLEFRLQTLGVRIERV